jgi:hypothetical protein
MSDSKTSGASIGRPRAPSGRSAATPYDKDVVMWSQEQARLLRAGRFAKLDIEHLVDEIEDVGKSEKRELASRMAVLLTHLLKWRSQPENRNKSLRWTTIVVQRKRIALALKETPSLKSVMRNRDWQKACGSMRARRRRRRRGLRLKTCPRFVPGRWIRRLNKISGRSEEPLRPRDRTSATLAKLTFLLRVSSPAC